MNNYIDLLPCPCCTGNAELLDNYKSSTFRVYCIVCQLTTKSFKTSFLAISAWNNRPENILLPIEDEKIYTIGHGWVVLSIGSYLRFEKTGQKAFEASMGFLKLGMRKFIKHD